MKWKKEVMAGHNKRGPQELCQGIKDHGRWPCQNCGAPRSERCVYPWDVALCRECLLDGPAWVTVALLGELVGVSE
jgi:late competence protein required for DNA uptake (superfamily II DNA/RNA helicase)